MRVTLGVLLALAPLFGVATAAAEEVVAPKTTNPILVRGRLASEKVRVGDERVLEYFVSVGARRYVIDGSEDVQARLNRLRSRYVTFETVIPDAKAKRIEISLERADAVSLQEPTLLEGVVRMVKPEKGPAIWRLESSGRIYIVDKRDVRRFKNFIDLNVVAKGVLTTDDLFGGIEKVSSVERKLLPGERAPEDGMTAFAGRWSGNLTATRIPKGIPSAKLGDYPIAFSADPAERGAKGRLMSTYDVVGSRVRSFKLKKRSIEFDIEYSFGQGSYAIRCEGSFSKDWKTIEGTWKSGFLGSGPFKLAFSADAAR